MGLRQNDLRNMLYDIFEVDSYASKMGADKDIVTLSFSLKEKQAAADLVTFLENAYTSVLDADSTSGEQSDGTYKVFVELERDKQVIKHISEIIEGIKKLSDISEFRFRYYKNFRSMPATEDNFKETIPTDSDQYGITANESNLSNYKNFFNNSYLERIDMLENTILLQKAYADPILLEFVDFGDTGTVLKSINESMDLMNSYPEIMFLTKYLGDYNICKYGDKIVFENQGQALVTKRVN